MNPKQPELLDQDAVNLAKAIRQTESGGNFAAKGKSGEYGAYQFTTPTWDKTAKRYGITSSLDKATPEQQNEVAYKQIKEWKDAGYNPGQIASLWNSGKPDAYLDTEYKGKNKYGVTYDVPAYAKSVATAYQQIKAGGNPQADPQNPSSTANTTPVTPPDQESTLSKIGNGINSVYNSIASPLVGLAAAPVQALAKATGQPDPYAKGIPSLGKENTPVSKLGLEEKIGDAAQVASYATPAKGLVGLIGSGLLQGAGAQMSQGESAGNVLKSGLIGGTISSGLGVAGKGITKLAEILPERITRAFIPGINEDTAKYAVKKGVGSLENMLNQSKKAMDDLGHSMKTILKSPQYANKAAQGNDVLSQVAVNFPDSNLTADSVADNLKKIVPLKSGLIDRFRKGSLSLDELRDLNTAIGKASYKTVFDDPAIKANKEIGAAAYQTISNYIKTTAPETVPLFDSFSKEIPLASAIEKAIRRGDKSKLVTLRDIVALVSGASALGPMGAAGGYLANKALESPTVNLKAAGLINKVTNPLLKTAGALAVPLTTKGILSATKNNETK